MYTNIIMKQTKIKTFKSIHSLQISIEEYNNACNLKKVTNMTWRDLLLYGIECKKREIESKQ